MRESVAEFYLRAVLSAVFRAFVFFLGGIYIFFKMSSASVSNPCEMCSY